VVAAEAAARSPAALQGLARMRGADQHARAEAIGMESRAHCRGMGETNKPITLDLPRACRSTSSCGRTKRRVERHVPCARCRAVVSTRRALPRRPSSSPSSPLLPPSCWDRFSRDQGNKRRAWAASRT